MEPMTRFAIGTNTVRMNRSSNALKPANTKPRFVRPIKICPAPGQANADSNVAKIVFFTASHPLLIDSYTIAKVEVC